MRVLNCGIDLGSRKVKIAIAPKEQPELMEFYSYDTIDFYRNYGKKEGNSLAVDFGALGFNQVNKVVSTGYGRNTLAISGGKVIPELKAHVEGAVFQTGLESFVLLDLGGQDSKVIQVTKGKMVDFNTNDKCAASSGRYLENMATILGISLEELSLHKDDPVELTSTCAVFGESELIGRIIEGYSIEQLAAGVNNTILQRVLPLLRNFKGNTLVFTGGVAHNQALRLMLKEATGMEIVVPKEPQFNGAIGCWSLGGKEG